MDNGPDRGCLVPHLRMLPATVGRNEGTVHLRADRATFVSASSSARNGVCFQGLCTCASKATLSIWFLAWVLTNGDLLLEEVWAQRPHL